MQSSRSSRVLRFSFGCLAVAFLNACGGGASDASNAFTASSVTAISSTASSAIVVSSSTTSLTQSSASSVSSVLPLSSTSSISNSNNSSIHSSTSLSAMSSSSVSSAVIIVSSASSRNVSSASSNLSSVKSSSSSLSSSIASLGSSSFSSSVNSSSSSSVFSASSVSSSSSSVALAGTCSPAITTPSPNSLKLLVKGANCAALGYAEYVPAAYASQAAWPLIIALNGDGQSGTGSATDIQKIDDDGLPKQVANGTWDPQKRFVVLAPQMNWETRTAVKLYDFIQFAKANYKIDPNRIYLTALSGGGGPFYRYIEAYSGGEIAAAVPVSTLYSFSSAPAPCMWKQVPTWLFFGENDTSAAVNSHATAPYNRLKACSPAPTVLPRLTVFSGVGHDAWSRTYNLSGINTTVVSGRDAYTMSVYDWLLQYSKNGSGVGSSSVASSSSISSSSSQLFYFFFLCDFNRLI